MKKVSKGIDIMKLIHDITEVNLKQQYNGGFK